MSDAVKQQIKDLLKKHNAVLLAHNYMRDEVQEIADITGDSLALSIEASKTDADVIVFCGIRPGEENLLVRRKNRRRLCHEVYTAEYDDIGSGSGSLNG